MTGTPRRIMTGYDKSGKSVILSDGHPPTELRIAERGVSFFEIWSTNASPALVAPTEAEPTDRPIEIPPKPTGP